MNSQNDFVDKYFWKQNWKNVLIIITCSLFYSFGSIMFLTKSASIPSGLSAVSITLAYVLPYLKKYLTLIYLGLNIPLILFFWNKIKRKFMVLTMIFLVFNALFGFIFGLDVINNFFSEKVFVFIDKAHIVENGATNIVNQGWPIFIYIILTLTLCSPTSAIVWKHGASTGGTDIIAHFFSTKKKKEVGKFLMIIGYTMATLSLIVVVSLKSVGSNQIKQNINGFQYIFGIQTVSSFVYIYANGIIVNMLYPKYKKVKLIIDSKEHQKIITWLEESEYWHPYKIIESTSGYTKQKIYSIETVVLLLESDDIAWKIKKVEPNAWISISPISKIYGRFNYSFIE